MITTEILGRRETTQAFANRVPAITSKVARALERLTIKLLARVKMKLSDDVLHVKSGRLRRSINYRMEGMGTDEMSGSVGTNVSYARPHELGFNGTVTVRAHMRQIKQAWGKDIAPRPVQVSSFARTMNLPERSFLRSAMREMQGEVVEDIAQAVKDAS